jgi:hypothetical protein
MAPPSVRTVPAALAIFASFKTDPNFVKVNTAPIASGPHGGQVDIYVDKAHATQFKSVGATAPDGMAVVKQSVTAPERLYLMKKVRGYDPANNDWYYANATQTGKLSSEGKPQLCISCHQAYVATDYMGAPSLEAAKPLLN